MDIIVGRQPIFNTNNDKYAYELLFRGGFEGVIEDINEKATSEVILNSLFYIGFEDLCSNKLAFINFSTDLLLKGIPNLLPKNQVVVELLEHVVPDDSILKACKKLHEDGYKLALDDFVFSDERFVELFEYIDIIKLDFMISDNAELQEIADRVKPYGIELLAEKVETKEEYEFAKSLGCKYFQGFFFQKPDTVSSKGINFHLASNASLIQEVNRSDIDYKELESIIKKEPALIYKLLKLINSPGIGVKYKISSIKQALGLLGIKKIKQWLYVVVFKEFCEETSTEMINLALIRGHFCENIVKQTDHKDRAEEFFLLGMFSAFDLVNGVNVSELANELPLNNDILAALRYEEGSPFKYLLDLIRSYEKNDWNQLNKIIEHTSFSEDCISKAYIDAIHEAHDLIMD